MLLPPSRLKRLTWDELDSLQHGHALQQQKALQGFRLLATQIYNFSPDEKRGALTPEQFLPLPLLDRPAPKPSVSNGESFAAWRASLVARNAQRLAPLSLP